MSAVETPMLKDNVKHVHAELMGKIDHNRLGARPAPLDFRGQTTGVATSETVREPSGAR